MSSESRFERLLQLLEKGACCPSMTWRARDASL
jgi:hypothetical protein